MAVRKKKLTALQHAMQKVEEMQIELQRIEQRHEARDREREAELVALREIAVAAEDRAARYRHALNVAGIDLMRLERDFADEGRRHLAHLARKIRQLMECVRLPSGDAGKQADPRKAA